MTVAWLVSMLCVGVMGFAIQRGATCTVAAVDEVLTRRRAHRLVAMLEASLWVAGGLALAQLAHLAGSMPAGYAVSAWTVMGAALLGLGAWVNKACVFGAVARLGSGEWAYAATPVGFYAGCLSEMRLFSRPMASALPDTSPLFQASALLAMIFVGFVLWRLRPGLLALRRPDRFDWLGQRVWTPHAATVVIGVSFIVTFLLAGRWAYTDVLADLARAMDSASVRLAMPVLLLIALYAGSLAGGLTAGRWQSIRVSARQVLQCFAGGVVMGWGSLLIPGSNDGLILIGIPLLHPYAWLAFATMFTTIAAAMSFDTFLRKFRGSQKTA
ncbi:YeeE/YedE family protein [Caenimonas koreensis DSM 17982]|uniref:YeeE/YedE family protein n=1 Tax=Caenimonas koreensis DSM 17982 TaxID=1121255 RepID=A0A844BBS1_9BURK|nr:YeeE/YedE thiosulfate transporter family protein [Caenimonas koreensis]MRD47951.1 YeeE/YedE family protein [Caenimonas koreensis DSM 17982]